MVSVVTTEAWHGIAGPTQSKTINWYINRSPGEKYMQLKNECWCDQYSVDIYKKSCLLQECKTWLIVNKPLLGSLLKIQDSRELYWQYIHIQVYTELKYCFPQASHDAFIEKIEDWIVTTNNFLSCLVTFETVLQSDSGLYHYGSVSVPVSCYLIWYQYHGQNFGTMTSLNCVWIINDRLSCPFHSSAYII